MASESVQVLREELVRARQIREAMREAGAGFAPDSVARFLRDSFMEPTEDDAQEVASLLEGLAATAAERLHHAGIEPAGDRTIPRTKLSKREREAVANMSMLLAGLSIALNVEGNDPEALRIGYEALAWGTLAGDLEQQAIAWRVIATTHERTGRFEELEHACLQQLEAARASNSRTRYIDAITHRLSVLVAQLRFEEARPLTAEAFELLHSAPPNPVVPVHRRPPYHAYLQLTEARILAADNNLPEAIRTLREAQQWADSELYPVTRSLIISQLGNIYLTLSQYRQCIECQLEVVQLADALGSRVVRAWGYLRLAEAHAALKEYDRATDLLAEADTFAPTIMLDLKLTIAGRRAELLLEGGRSEEAAELARWIIDAIGDRPMPVRMILALLTLGETEERAHRYEAAAEYFRAANNLADREIPGRGWRAKLRLGEALTKLHRYDEAAAALADFADGGGIKPEIQAAVCRLWGTIAEARGDIRAVLEHEREGFAIERMLLESKAEQSLRNARVMAQIDLLERETELERERRRRLERELADAVVALGDRKRLVRTVEERLRTALTRGGATEQTATAALREALTSLRADTATKETQLHYLAGVEEEFYQRLRLRFPGLTRKQERLCGLLRAGLDSKEIATLMELGSEGVKAQRKRLRKRLGLEQEESLENVMAGI